MRSGRRGWFRLVAVLLGTLAGLVIAEGLLRVSGLRTELARQRTVFEPRYGTVRRDSWMYDFEVSGTGATLHGARVSIPKPPAELRVLFVGDSGIEGVRIAPEQTVPAQFEGRIRARQPGLRALNAGVFGMTTLDEWHFYEDKLRVLAPDVVVVGLFMSNDINFNLGHVARVRRMTTPWRALDWLVDRSALCHLVATQLLAHSTFHNALFGWLRTSLVAEEMALVDAHGLHMLSYPMGEVATYLKRPSPLVQRAFSVLEEALLLFQRSARRDGFHLVVLLVPSPSAVVGTLRLLHYPDILADLERAGVFLSLTDLDVGLPTRRVLSICTRIGVVCIDPTARMAAMGRGVFFPDDEHPTALGHAIMAEALEAELDRVLPMSRGQLGKRTEVR